MKILIIAIHVLRSYDTRYHLTMVVLRSFGDPGLCLIMILYIIKLSYSARTRPERVAVHGWCRMGPHHEEGRYMRPCLNLSSCDL